jgi:hypothetical protein
MSVIGLNRVVLTVVRPLLVYPDERTSLDRANRSDTAWVNRVTLTARRSLTVLPDLQTLSESFGKYQKCR